MARSGIAGTLQTLRVRWQICWSDFFNGRCLVGFPWFWPARPPGVPVMLAARWMARRQFGRDHHPLYRALAQLLAALIWPPAVLLQLCMIRYFGGPEAVTIKQVPGALWAALRHNVVPSEYYAYGLWQPDRKVNIDNYLYAKEGPRLFKVLNRPSRPNPIDDKLTFHEMCKAHALPSPEILAAFAPTGKLLAFETGRVPKRDLFVKPRIGVGRNGAEHFRWHGAVFESDRYCRVRPEDLPDYLATRARTENRTLLVQPALSNHPKLCAGANAYLAPARVVTGLSSNGDVVPIFAHIDFFYFAGINQKPAAPRKASIDMTSGRLMSAPREPYGAKSSNHQLGKDSDEGVVLPDWDTVLQHTKVAHQACSNFVFLGWDVAFTEHGPMLLEGNVNWTASDYQRLHGEPLGHTKFADILAMRLPRLSERLSDCPPPPPFRW